MGDAKLGSEKSRQHTQKIIARLYKNNFRRMIMKLKESSPGITYGSPVTQEWWKLSRYQKLKQVRQQTGYLHPIREMT
jgi:hypothetical protein